MFFRVFCLLNIACLLFVNAVCAQEIQVLKISAESELATIKTADGKIRMVKAGDNISKGEFRVQSSESEKQSAKDKVQSAASKESSEFKVQSAGLSVTEISEGRIVLEERTNRGFETIIIRLEDGKQKIERISKVPDRNPSYGHGEVKKVQSSE